jgi:hypothetical protein
METRYVIEMTDTESSLTYFYGGFDRDAFYRSLHDKPVATFETAKEAKRYADLLIQLGRMASKNFRILPVNYSFHISLKDK